MYTLEERIEMLNSAAELIREAVGIIEEAVVDTDIASMVDAYTIAQLNNYANGGNPYDQTIPKTIEDLEKYEAEAAELEREMAEDGD